jgi:dipeptidase E
MSLIFLSNTRGNNNVEVWKEIKHLLGEEKRIAYIPTSKDTERKYFHEVEAFFNKIGMYQLEYFGLYEGEWEESFPSRIVECDAIYISGGNTYNLLHHIQLRGIANLIRAFAQERTVIGSSAGGILMTPSIAISQEPNEFNVTDLTGLSLVDFYFYPHYKPELEKPKELQEFMEMMKDTDVRIYGVTEYSGISLENGTMKFLGEVHQLQ